MLAKCLQHASNLPQNSALTFETWYSEKRRVEESRGEMSHIRKEAMSNTPEKKQAPSSARVEWGALALLEDFGLNVESAGAGVGAGVREGEVGARGGSTNCITMPPLTILPNSHRNLTPFAFTGSYIIFLDEDGYHVLPLGEVETED